MASEEDEQLSGGVVLQPVPLSIRVERETQRLVRRVEGGGVGIEVPHHVVGDTGAKRRARVPAHEQQDPEVATGSTAVAAERKKFRRPPGEGKLGIL